MALPTTFHRKNTTPETAPGSVSFVRQQPTDQHVRGYVAGSSGPPLPILGPAENVIFLGTGQSLPASPMLGAVYVSVSEKTIYFVDPSGDVLVHAITEGSILANIYWADAATPVSSTGTGNVTMLTMSETFDPGWYCVDVCYGWTCDNGSQDFIAEVLVDGVPIGQPHQQEPKDTAGSVSWTNTNQLHTGSKRFFVDFMAGGAHTIEVRFRASANGVPVSMFDTTIMALNMTALA